MAARKKAKKASGKKRTSKKSVAPVQPAASSIQAELAELRAMKAETAGELEALKKERADLKTERDLARINSDLAAGKSPELQSPQESEEDRISRQRQEARDERRRKREEERQAKRSQEPSKKVASLDEARAKKTPSNPAAQEDKKLFTMPMDELHKWKLEGLNRNYADELKKIKEPLIAKYNQMLDAEARELAQRDPECVKAHREQIECINELVKLLDDQLPEGYAITQLLTDKSLIVAQYVPNRAGKPLPLPEMASPEE